MFSNRIVTTSAQKLLITIGTNDLDLQLKTFETRLSQLINTARRKFPAAKLILSSIPFRGRISVDHVNSFNSYIKRFCSKEGLGFVDIIPQLKMDMFVGDHIHLNSSGSSYVANCYKNALVDNSKMGNQSLSIPTAPP